MAEQDEQDQNPETTDPVETGETTEAPEPTSAQVAFDVAQETGVNHDDALVEHVPNPTAAEAAPDDVDTDVQAGVLDDGTYQAEPPKTMAEQSAPSLEGEAYRKGYFGEVAADRVQTNAEAVAAVPNKDEE